MKFLIPVLLLALLLPGCAEMHPADQIVLTPVTVVRDVVDLPVVAVTNVFQLWADRTNPNPTPHAGAGWTWQGGFDFGIGINLSHWVFQSVSWVFGATDYLVCRSLYPNFPNGISPWRGQEPWGTLWFPNTKALWAEPSAEPVQP